ncbi:MAG: tryptophan 7-halogenase [Burkholderiaceae bacterium]|nr:tryptophan 7-halogenase [Burkholderiaceae bacterium]
MRTAADIKKIVIVGGGTAGWMTALTLAKALIKKGIEITLLESPMIDIIGVGEGSTPPLQKFFQAMEIEESEWMPQCNATYKSGITFDGWSTKPGFETFFHTFASILDNFTMPQFVKNVQARLNGADVYAHPDRFFIAHKLAVNNLAPKPNANFPFDVWYSYHFDATLLGRFLHKKAVERGVKYKSCHVTHAQLNEQGEISAVVTKEGETIAADFFVDCTGFAAMLIQKTLNTPYVSFANNLFNDAAVALPTTIGDGIPSQTISTALKHGWAWTIPLTNRFGNGYVYSSAFCSADQAEHELREKLGLLESDTPARHLKMKIGRVEKHWNRNCLAVGLSQGFIEPLEATGISFIQRTAAVFVDFLEMGDLSDAAQLKFNQQINRAFECTRDFIVTHYKTNSRTDTEYWRANAANMELSDSLKQLYAAWMSGKNFAAEISRQEIGQYFAIVSWYSIMAGMGIFPDDLRPSGTPSDGMEQVDNLLQRSLLNFRDHRAVLMDIPQRDPHAVQTYFWASR